MHFPSKNPKNKVFYPLPGLALSDHFSFPKTSLHSNYFPKVKNWLSNLHFFGYAPFSVDLTQFAFFSSAMRRQMKIFVIFFTICFLQQFSTIFAAPKLEVRQLLEQTSVISGKELRGVLHLKNSGDEPLKIGGVRSSCGCTPFV